MVIAGVYLIENRVNGKIYCGSSQNISKRFYKHKRELKKCMHKNRHLQAAYNKYGEENFIYRIVELVDTENLEAREQIWLDQFDKANRYNIRDRVESNRGVKRDEDFKKKMSECLTVRPDDIEVIKTKEFITVADAELLCQMSKRKIHNFIKNRHVKTIKKEDGRLLIDREDLLIKRKIYTNNKHVPSSGEQYLPSKWVKVELGLTEEEIMWLIENKTFDTKKFYRQLHISCSSIKNYLMNKKIILCLEEK